MFAAIVQFIASSTIIVIAAIALTRFSDQFARATRLGHLIVGSIFLATATSLPELSMNWAIVRLDLPDMAIGGLIGSSLLNLGILAIADLSHESRGALFSRRSIETALPGVISIAMTAVVGIGIFVGNQVGWWEVAGLGLFSILLIIVYVLGIRLVFRDQLNGRSDLLRSEGQPIRDRSKMIRRSLIGYVICAAVIIVVAPWSASAAGSIAAKSGLGDTFVGTTIVAFTTSLPELVACIAAVRIGAMNLAIGNVFGSNTFNMLLLIPLDLGYPGSLIGAGSFTHILTVMFVVLVTATVIIGQLYRVESRSMLVEPDAALILLLVFIGLVAVYFCK